MSQQNLSNNTFSQLRAMGMNEEAIAMYRQQMERSINLTNQWASQLGQNTDPMNAMRPGIWEPLGSFDNDDEQPKLQLNPCIHSYHESSSGLLPGGADLAMLNGQFLNDVTTGFSKAECRQLLSRSGGISTVKKNCWK